MHIIFNIYIYILILHTKNISHANCRAGTSLIKGGGIR